MCGHNEQRLSIHYTHTHTQNPNNIELGILLVDKDEQRIHISRQLLISLLCLRHHRSTCTQPHTKQTSQQRQQILLYTKTKYNKSVHLVCLCGCFLGMRRKIQYNVLNQQIHFFAFHKSNLKRPCSYCRRRRRFTTPPPPTVHYMSVYECSKQENLSAGEQFMWGVGGGGRDGVRIYTKDDQINLS